MLMNNHLVNSCGYEIAVGFLHPPINSFITFLLFTFLTLYKSILTSSNHICKSAIKAIINVPIHQMGGLCAHEQAMVWHLSRVDSATSWIIACQAPLSMGFSRQEYWSGLPCPPPGGLTNPGIKSVSLMSAALAGRFFTNSATWKACLWT